MPYLSNKSLHAARAAALTLSTLLFLSSGNAQPIQLLKDLQPGIWQQDQRQISQVLTTTDSIYMVSQRTKSGGYGQSYYINSSNGTGLELNLGLSLGEDRIFGENVFAVKDHPFFALRDGKAIFAESNSFLRSRFMELDGVTGKAVPVTIPIDAAPPFATWMCAN